MARRKHSECCAFVLRMFWMVVLTTGAAHSPSTLTAGPGGQRASADRVQRRDPMNTAPKQQAVDRKEDREVVFLLHGICKNSFDMAFVAQSLRQQGYQVVNWNYPSRSHDLKGLADRLAEAVAKFKDRRVSFVTHSMGGIVVRTYLSNHKPENVGRLVMIAPPNKGAILADLLGDWLMYKLVFGPAGQQLRQGENGGCADAGVPHCEFGVIAGGNGKLHGMNPIIPGDNDGTVSVECTKLEGMADFMVVPYGHTYIQFMPRTVENALHFLQRGHFAENCPDMPKSDERADVRETDALPAAAGH